MPTEEEQILSAIKGHHSFFLMAGAGAGKTWALKETLDSLSKGGAFKEGLLAGGQRIAAITYTNNAANEIQRRVDSDPAFWISTVHGFAWECIRPYFENIRDYLIEIYFAPHPEDSTKKSLEREEKKKKIVEMEETFFVYNPIGANDKANSLQHDEVISAFAWFLANKPAFQKIVLANFPIILIDECQDTAKEAINALFSLLKKDPGKLLLGMFGDTMQTIYLSGETNLQQLMDDNHFIRIDKTVNHRSADRIIELGNSIRASAGRPNEKQTKGEQKTGPGIVRFFLIPQENFDFSIEKQASNCMKKFVGESWDDTQKSIANPNYPRELALTHKMAARRGDFFALFSSFSKNQRDSMGDETSPIFNFLKDYAAKLYDAFVRKDYFLLTGIIQKGADADFLSKNNVPNLFQKTIVELNALPRPSSIRDFVSPFIRNHLLRFGEDVTNAILRPDPTDENQNFLGQSVAEAKNLVDHYSDDSLYFTQQGVKGLEFNNVIVIINDAEAAADRYWMFKYSDLFNTDPTSIRNKYLFYVQCTRAKEALAIIAYMKPKDCQMFRTNLVANHFAKEEEILLFNPSVGKFEIFSD